MTEGIKYDTDKLDWTLLPWEALEEVVQVLQFGEIKYERDNWKYVKPDVRYIKAAFRHLIDYDIGEVNDSETSISHLAHAVCCLLFKIYKDKEKLNEENTLSTPSGEDNGLQLLFDFN